MPKKAIKKSWISSERLAELHRAMLTASMGASVRLAGPKVTDKEVKRILNAIGKSSVQKQIYQINLGSLGIFVLFPYNFINIIEIKPF